ncbi:MAG TPA: hypothetical protein VFR86_16820 [Burkholderiaceae bacterium]|nr:hypothetical protein [Burkholderiaceae bacterium]
MNRQAVVHVRIERLIVDAGVRATTPQLRAQVQAVLAQRLTSAAAATGLAPALTQHIGGAVAAEVAARMRHAPAPVVPAASAASAIVCASGGRRGA